MNIDYSKPPKMTAFSKRNARILAVTIAIGFPAIFFYNVVQTHFFRLNRAFSDIHMVTVNVVASESHRSYPLIEISAQESCTKLLEKAQASSVASSSTVSSVSVSSIASTAASATHSGAASSVPEFVLPEPIQPLETPPSCVAPVKLPEGVERLGAESFITLELTINKSGKVIRTDVLGSSGFDDLDQATSEQVTAAWKLEPCMSNGVAVDCKRQVRVRWAK